VHANGLCVAYKTGTFRLSVGNAPAPLPSAKPSWRDSVKQATQLRAENDAVGQPLTPREVPLEDVSDDMELPF
jgi:hypothetical protein